ncbi:MAG: hypothetical protein IJ024_07630 [Lachnospiraceae bacterium]|nr:hypothetical protein [Lachnospiraceae bacterium]
MKRTIFFLIGLILAGTFAYFAGYYVYTAENPKAEVLEPATLQKAVPLSNENNLQMNEEYYIAKIEQDVLSIYKMPEETLYDSIELSGLHFVGKEEQELSEGIIFQNLTEVFEFLENSMS